MQWSRWGLDRIHHGFWSHMDPAHPKYEKGNPFESAILDYHRHIDRELAEVPGALSAGDALVLVVSDHGSKKMDGGICFNEWLMRARATLDAHRPARPSSTPIGRATIDWSRTKAWGDGGYYGRLFMNVEGAGALGGTIAPGDYERVRNDLIAGT